MRLLIFNAGSSSLKFQLFEVGDAGLQSVAKGAVSGFGADARVALIASMEVFITIFLSVWIFRTKEKLTANTLIAACLGVAGTALILLL